MRGEVGKIVGEATPYEFSFQIYNPLEVKKGDFVKVWNDADGWFAAYVSEIKAVSKSDERDGSETYLAKAVVLGKRSGKSIVLPKSPFVPGDRVFKAEEDFVAECLGFYEDGVYLGYLGDTKIKVTLNPNTLVQKHVCILAKTGSGKSYTAAVIIEELLEKDVALLIIDPHGEYESLKYPNDDESLEEFGLKPKGYADKVKMFVPPKSPLADKADGILRLDGINLSAEEIIEMGEIRKSSAQAAIYQLIREMRGRTYTIQDLIYEAEQLSGNLKAEIIGALTKIEETDLFSENPTPIEVLMQKGKAVILNLAGIDPIHQDIIVAKVCREIFEMRKRGEIDPGMIVVDEAHNFVPEKGIDKSVSSSVLRTIASEGRKFALGLMIISQRPARIDKNVLSQCNTQIILRVTNPNDINSIKRGVEGITSEMVEEIKRLPVGQALVITPDLERPVIVRVRTRKSKHKEAEEIIKVEKKKARKEEKKRDTPKKEVKEKKGGFFKKLFGGD